VSADGTRIYFASNRGGDFDIFEAVGRGDGTFAPPTAVPSIRTARLENSPVVTKDLLTIFFSVDRAGGKGSDDIWRTHRADLSAEFGPPENVAELATAAPEWPGWISLDGCRLYFSSKRDTSFDVYVASRPP
jgi:Tol biopolymer transport system component